MPAGSDLPHLDSNIFSHLEARQLVFFGSETVCQAYEYEAFLLNTGGVFGLGPL